MIERPKEKWYKDLKIINSATLGNEGKKDVMMDEI